MKKILNKVEIVEDLQYTLDGSTIDEAIATLTRIKLENVKYSKLHLNIDYEQDYGDSVSIVVQVKGERPETPEETAHREKEEATWKERSLAYKRIQLETLKKELGVK